MRVAGFSITMTDACERDRVCGHVTKACIQQQSIGYMYNFLRSRDPQKVNPKMTAPSWRVNSSPRSVITGLQHLVHFKRASKAHDAGRSRVSIPKTDAYVNLTNFLQEQTSKSHSSSSTKPSLQRSSTSLGHHLDRHGRRSRLHSRTISRGPTRGGSSISDRVGPAGCRNHSASRVNPATRTALLVNVAATDGRVRGGRSGPGAWSLGRLLAAGRGLLRFGGGLLAGRGGGCGGAGGHGRAAPAGVVAPGCGLRAADGEIDLVVSADGVAS